MNKEDTLKLAITLVSGSFRAEIFGTPNNVGQISAALRVAYNAVIDAYGKIPDTGPAPTTN